MSSSSCDVFSPAPSLDRSAAGFARRQRHLEETAAVVGRLAHDFGNILTSILGFAELAQTKPALDAEAALHLKEIQRSAQQGAEFIRDLRSFSRRRAVQPSPSSLAAAVADEEARLRPALPQGCKLFMAVPADLPPVAVDAEPLRQVLGRLLDNAHEACAGNDGQVMLSARLVELKAADVQELLGSATPGPHLEVTITDNGEGLSPVAQQSLFYELFFSSKPRHRGLGLAVVYGTLLAYRGGLRLEPGEKRGTMARVFLPVAVRAASVATDRGGRLPALDEAMSPSIDRLSGASSGARTPALTTSTSKGAYTW